MGEYHRTRKNQKRGHYVMLVAQHKRQVDGPAVISFVKELKEMLHVYVEKKRPYENLRMRTSS